MRRMRDVGMRWWTALVVVACAMTVMMPRAGAGGPDFYGEFAVTDVVEQGDVVTCTLTLRLTNQTGADLTAVRAELVDGVLLHERLGEFVAFDAPERMPVTLDGTFTVPAREFAQWSEGGAPQVRLDYVNGDGDATNTMAALFPALLPVGEN